MNEPRVAQLVKAGAVLWYAPVGEPLPDVHTVEVGDDWGGNWRRVGYTSEPLRFLYTDEQLDIVVEEELAPINRFRIREGVEVRTTLAEFTGHSVGLAVDAPVTQHASGPAQKAFEEAALGGSVLLRKYTWGFETFWVDESGTRRAVRMFVYRATVRMEGDVVLSRRDESIPAVHISIKALADPRRLALFQRVTGDAYLYAATTAGGLYRARFDTEETMIWSRVGQQLPIAQIGYDLLQPGRVQVALSAGDIWLRRPAASDDWQIVLTAASIGSGEFSWAAYNPFRDRLYALWDYELGGGGVWLFTSDDWGVTWSPKALYTHWLNYASGCIAIGPAAGDAVICTGTVAAGARGNIWISLDGGDTFAPRESISSGGWWPYVFFTDDGDDAVAYCGLEPGVLNRMTLSPFSLDDSVDNGLEGGPISPGVYAGAYREQRIATARGLSSFFYGSAGALEGTRALHANMRAIVLAEEGWTILGQQTLAGPGPHQYSHLVYLSNDDGATLIPAAGVNSNLPDGGGDSIPYTAQRIAQDGLALET